MSKYSEGKPRSYENYPKSSIWKYLHEDIDTILAINLDNTQQKKSYVPLLEIECQLSQLLKYNTEQRYYMLSGLTGIGKTTVMRHVFFSDKSDNKSIIKNGNLIIPIDFDSYIEPSPGNECGAAFESMYINAFLQAALLVQNKFSLSAITDAEFVKFFDQNHIGVISYIDEYGNRNSLEKMRKEVYKNIHNRIYAVIAELCIFLNRKESKIKNVILIVDNIESLGIYETSIQVPLLIAHKAINFMCKKSIAKKNNQAKWVPNILICCRHYIYRMMHSREFEDGALSQIFESYSQPVYIDLDNSAAFADIIKYRFNAYLDAKVKDERRNSINIVHDMLFKILDKVNIDNRNIILDFNLGDIRRSLKTTKDIIYNKTWIQRDDFEDNGSFIIDNLSDFNCSLTNILRAIGMKSGYIYNHEHNLIPNLLENTSDNDVNIYDLITLCYFRQIASSWRTPLKVSTYYSHIKHIFPNTDLIQKAQLSIWRLLKNRMLLRSADQEQKDTSSITFGNYNTIESVYLSNAARDYWALLGENSAIFEMLMDDIYLNESYQFETDRQIRYKLFDKESFYIGLCYLEEIVNKEESVVKIAIDSNTVEEYKKYFGNKLVCEHILQGLRQSFDNYFRNPRNDEKEYIANCTNRIKRLEKSITQLKSKLQN